MNKPTLETLTSLAKRRGFIYQGSEIYGGLSGTWDYGPYGAQLKRNICSLWWDTFINTRTDIYGVDAAILMPEPVWEASGHIAGFKDPMAVCFNCHSQLRADHLVEEEIEKNKSKGLVYEENTGTIDSLSKNLRVFKPNCPICGQKNAFNKVGVRQFNMMLKTQLGSVEGEGTEAFLRPETAQGIFTNFKNIIDSFYPDVPFGIAQIGKAFRNEIAPRDFIFRTREFEQMEIEYFIREEDWENEFDKWIKSVYDFLKKVGIEKKEIHELEVPEEERAHYSKRTIDFEFDYPFGRKELLGLAYRTDYDLRNHDKVSGKKLVYKPKDGGEPFTPHVIEPSFGVDRLILAVLLSAYTEEKVEGEKRVVLKLNPAIAPVQVAVLPLSKNEKLTPLAEKVFNQLKENFVCEYDETQSIGKRYRRQDEIGTPYCVTVDFDSLEDDAVTIRDRDSMKQERVKIEDLIEKLSPKFNATQ